MSSKVIVTIFGASGDLAKRKLYPSLFRLYKSGNLSKHFAVIGTARRPWSKEYFESVVVESIADLADSPEQAQEFAATFFYTQFFGKGDLDIVNVVAVPNILKK